MEEEYLFPFFFPLEKLLGRSRFFVLEELTGDGLAKKKRKKRSKGEKNITTVHRETRREDAKEGSDAKREPKLRTRPCPWSFLAKKRKEKKKTKPTTKMEPRPRPVISLLTPGSSRCCWFLACVQQQPVVPLAILLFFFQQLTLHPAAEHLHPPSTQQVTTNNKTCIPWRDASRDAPANRDGYRICPFRWKCVDTRTIEKKRKKKPWRPSVHLHRRKEKIYIKFLHIFPNATCTGQSSVNNTSHKSGMNNRFPIQQEPNFLSFFLEWIYPFNLLILLRVSYRHV